MIKYIVQNDNNSYELTEEKLMELLLKACFDQKKENERKQNNNLVLLFCDLLINTKFIVSNNLNSIIQSSFNLGFYYAKFLEKNKVIIKEE